MGWISDFVDDVGDVAEGAVKTVGGAVNVVTETVTGGSTSDALAEVGQGLNKSAGAMADISSAGQGDKIDALTGGLYSAGTNVNQFAGDLLQGKSVRDNLKDSARVAAVTAATVYGGPASGMAVNTGLSRDGKTNLSFKSVLATGFRSVGMGQIASAIDPYPQNQSSGNQEYGYYSDDPSQIYQGENKPNVLIPIVLGITILTIVVIKKKKK